MVNDKTDLPTVLWVRQLRPWRDVDALSIGQEMRHFGFQAGVYRNVARLGRRVVVGCGGVSVLMQGVFVLSMAVGAGVASNRPCGPGPVALMGNQLEFDVGTSRR